MRLRLNEEENVNVKNSPWCGSEKPDVLLDGYILCSNKRRQSPAYPTPCSNANMSCHLKFSNNLYKIVRSIPVFSAHLCK